MSDVSHRGDISTHPDVSEMRERYARMLGGRDVALVDGPVFLLGLYCAASPWIVHYTTSQPSLMAHNLIMGIAIGLLATGCGGGEVGGRVSHRLRAGSGAPGG
ncbi:SPW repeat protein, partial [Streptomyces sp. NPDC002586]